MNDGIKMIGLVNLKAWDKNGSLKFDTGWSKNQIMNNGRKQVALLMGSAAASTFGFLGVGTKAGAGTSAMTTLSAEITDSGLARASAVFTRQTVSGVVSAASQWVKTWTVISAKTVEEIGIFTHVTGNVMLGRKLTTSKALSAGDTLQGTYKVIFA